ncbi:bifunctional serine/threonine-protein kinase/formylglycine-generating enzyme family protein [Aquisphaera insulae]|uniref:bifunctional serine/threonine-protein kinase/formylglycine-generating enzyme family protein n=1 Tax=Aquisphaera insulae TaxID=2712864 RepID=UPI0013E9ED0C|nr:bifunctional serine/threonine-protein kinase/formylglycine-generating enzyme family protein [Aquisphaera insulae]
MNRCPSAQSLAAWVNGELIDTELAEVEAHVESCAACWERLDHVLADLEPIDPLLDRLRTSQTDEIRGELAFLAELGERPPAIAATSAANPPRDGARQDEARPSGPGERYEVIRLENRGGLGELYLARDREVPREVVLKQIREEAANQAALRARFLREAEITGGLEHPGIVPVYGRGTDARGRPYYAMRLIRGTSLEQAIRDFHQGAGEDDPAARNLAFRSLLRKLIDACNTLAYAHSRGVVHRDVKPGNIMLGPFGETLVVDWGLAKSPDDRPGPPRPHGESRPDEMAPQTEPELTRADDRIGTPAFMSPEQAWGRHGEVGPASDTYSLGATLYAILTGRSPVRGSDSAEVLEKASRGDFPRPRAVRYDMDPRLEAICLKAMSLRPADRYPSPAGLAADMEKWLAGEPVSAYPDPRIDRALRWARRHRVIVASATSAMPLAILAASLVWGQIRVDSSTARALVAALETADTRNVPQIAGQLQRYRRWAEQPLLAMYRDRPEGSDARLHAALALRPIDADRRAFLRRRLLSPRTGPDQLIIIRETLGGDEDRPSWLPELWGLVSEADPNLTDEPLRAAAVLSLLSPEDGRWQALAPRVAEGLTRQNPLLIGAWGRAFEPIAGVLKVPLRTILGDRDRVEARALAFSILLDYANRPSNADRAVDLAEILPDAEPGPFDDIISQVGSLPAEERDAAIAALERHVEGPVDPGEVPSHRACQVVISLLRLGHPRWAWRFLGEPANHGGRAEWIHAWRGLGVAPRAICERLPVESNVFARRALILGLGEGPSEDTAAAGLDAIAGTLVDWYRNDPDPGIHGAVDWLLRRRRGRGRAPELDAIDQELAGERISRDRRWYVDHHGSTFVILRGPVEFRMGSPTDEPGRLPNETPLRRRIDRTFAIAADEVTVGQYRRFLGEDPRTPDILNIPAVRAALPSDDRPMTAIEWYEAARYCNWLSRAEGIPKEEWFYPDPAQPDMTLRAANLARTGYRMATNAEWEFACRAGAASSRPFGADERWLDGYVWHRKNSGGLLQPIGRLKPNDFGLFDMLGNAVEWTTTPFVTEATGAVEPIPDRFADAAVTDNLPLEVRGGSLHYAVEGLRSAHSFPYRPSVRDLQVGFRVARTLP